MYYVDLLPTTKSILDILIDSDFPFISLQSTSDSGSQFPAYNIGRIDKSGDAPEKWIIELAIAGYNKNQLSVILDGTSLIIQGKASTSYSNIIYEKLGITGKDFTRTFSIKDGATVGDITFENGLLSIFIYFPKKENSSKVFQIK